MIGCLKAWKRVSFQTFWPPGFKPPGFIASQPSSYELSATSYELIGTPEPIELDTDCFTAYSRREVIVIIED